MNKLYESLKVDCALAPQAINNTNVTGRYFSMKDVKRALFIFNSAVFAATKTAKIEVLEATDVDGTGAAAIASASATITANTYASEVTVALASVANTDIVTVNGISFTKAAALDASAREFNTAANLVTCIEDETYGVSDVKGSVNGTTVTLYPNSGKTYLTVTKTEVSGTITIATTKATAHVEVENMSLSFGNDHVACKVTCTDSTGNNLNSVTLLREMKLLPTQKVGASAAV